MKKVYLEELMSLMKCGCGKPGCTEKAEFLHATCHPASGIDVRFIEDCIELYCKECKKFVIRIVVAKLL